MRVALTFFVLGALANPALAVEIRLKDEAQCVSPIVRLGDIAEIMHPATAAAEAENSPLADLALFPAPATQQPRELKRQELRELLALCDVDLRGCQFSGAETVVIRASQTAVQAAGQAEERTIIRPALHLIPASAYVQKSAAKESQKAAAAAKPIEAPKLVHRNKAVTIHSLWPGVKITASGKSLADAALGESVLVEQADSKARLLAKVVGPQTVEVRPETK